MLPLDEDDIGTLDLATEVDRMLDPHVLCRVAVGLHERVDIKLADCLLGSEFDALFANEAFNIWDVAAPAVSHLDPLRECGDVCTVKERTLVRARIEKSVEDVHVRPPAVVLFSEL